MKDNTSEEITTQGLTLQHLAVGSIYSSDLVVLDQGGDKIWDIEVSADRQTLTVTRADGEVMSVVPQFCNVVRLEIR